MTEDLAAATDVDDYGLGRLTIEPNVRTTWPKEAGDFTPWLFSNLDLLAEAVGLTLVPDGMEHPVGGYRLDILAKDSMGNNVAIENQVEQADHSHLGQLLLYSAHVEADTAIWVATKFSDQHRQALIWLNESTREGVRFFGVEVSIVRIGASPPAPVFNVVVRPNELQKSDASVNNNELSDASVARRAFMTTVLQDVAKQLPTVKVPTGQSWTSYMNFKSGPFGTYGIVFTKAQTLRVEAYLDGRKEVNEALFDELFASKEAWEQKLGFQLDWERMDGAKASRLSCSNDFWLPGSEAAQDSARAWAVQRIVKLVTVLDSTLRTRASTLIKQMSEE